MHLLTLFNIIVITIVYYEQLLKLHVYYIISRERRQHDRQIIRIKKKIKYNRRRLVKIII